MVFVFNLIAMFPPFTKKSEPVYCFAKFVFLRLVGDYYIDLQYTNEFCLE